MKISKEVSDYLDGHTIIKDCIKKNIINFSDLARLIIKELNLNINNFHAALIACRRYAEKLNYASQEKKILAILHKSKMNIRTKLASIVFSREVKVQAIHFLRGEASWTAIIDSANLEKIKETNSHSITKIKKNLAEIAIIGPAETEKTIGVSAFLTAILADANINVLTIIGSSNEDIFIINNTDVSKAIELLTKIIS